jgi:D-alanyl-D-alanine carboxypeptidase
MHLARAGRSSACGHRQGSVRYFPLYLSSVTIFHSATLQDHALRAVAFYLPEPLRRFFALILVVAAVASCSTTSGDLGMPVIEPLSEKYAAIVVDANTGAVLYQMNAQEPRFPASLTKMMTLYMIFEAMEQGRVQPTTPIVVSAYAASRPPTKIGFRAGDTVSVEEAVMALIVRSANDVATAVAEHFGGDEAGFAAMMTERARALGMRDTVFRNASGLPDSAQVTTARDMAVLSGALRAHHPRHYHYFSNRDFVYRGTTIRGHNELIGSMAGVDGIKTGYIRASGFNLATSVSRDGRRIIAVVMGGNTSSARNDHMRRLIEIFLPRASRARSS